MDGVVGTRTHSGCSPRPCGAKTPSLQFTRGLIDSAAYSTNVTTPRDQHGWFSAASLLGAENPQAVVALKVLVIFQIERGQRQIIGQAAGSDPHVVHWAGTPTRDSRS